MTVHDPRRELLNAPPGWGQLIDDLVRDLSELDIDIEIQQVKEKFGGLRFYVNHALDSDGPKVVLAEELIEEAEEKSFTICEQCGGPGETRYDGWLRTLCDECDGGSE